MTRKLCVYIAGPISKGDMLHNVRQADEAFFALLKAGIAPLNPMWSVFAGSVCRPWLFDGREVAFADATPAGTTHEDWMGADLPWVERSDAVLRLPGESVGADRECRHASMHGVPVFYSVEKLLEWDKERKAA